MNSTTVLGNVADKGDLPKPAEGAHTPADEPVRTDEVF